MVSVLGGLARFNFLFGVCNFFDELARDCLNNIAVFFSKGKIDFYFLVRLSVLFA